MTLIKMPVKGKAELQFWIRAFQLQDEIDHVVNILSTGDPRRRTAFAPIVSEYKCGNDIMWVFMLGPTIDSLGLVGGAGLVWLTTGKKHLMEAVEERNKLADEIIDEAETQGKFDELIEMEPKKDV